MPCVNLSYIFRNRAILKQHPETFTSARELYQAVMRVFIGAPSRADLINAESALGSRLFGPIPAGHRREFFHDRENIWIWHEEWTDEQSHPRQITVRYEVRTNGVFKKISAGAYFLLEGEELQNFRRAAHAYLSAIKANLYPTPRAAVKA